ncbi:MAG: PASTA domain-containing protein [Ruminococcaceae bacterium]|nr:PASTA domain-containing protein [Oscillospiraceae bacterium]
MSGGRVLKRAGVVLVALCLVFVLLTARIFSIQFFGFEKYQKKVLDQLTTESPVRAARGEILDCNGRVLATNRTVYRVSIFPNVIAKAENSVQISEKIAKGLSDRLDGVDYNSVMEHISHKTALERTVARSVNEETADNVLDFIKENNYTEMIKVDAVNTRYYPYGTLASHVLGFTGSDGQGLYGLELQYNAAMSGTDGAYITARDSMGNELPNSYEAYVAPIEGNTLHTTLDAYVQSVLEKEVENAMIESGAQNRVCGIVMDVNTGAILGMATAPGFDLNEPFSLNESALRALEALDLEKDSEAYRAAKNQLLLEMWSNKAATEIYMPGSTFKTLTCSMVLEEDAVIDLNERFFCSGALHVADRTIRCHKKGGHGSITFAEGLQNSCNPVMMTIAARLGCDTFYEYVKAFGLLEKTGIDLPGEGGSIFHAPTAFTELDLATASFGQNFKISVLQLICAVAAVANGGHLLSPYLVERMTDANGKVVYTHEIKERRTVISAETARTVCEILAGGVAGNGGAKNAYVAGYRVAAKTGTSEKIGDDASARIGSCIAFAPADAPEIAVLIVVDEPTEGIKYGSVVAAPYVANVLEAILPYLGTKAVYTEEEEKQLSLRVPDCSGWGAEKVAQTLTQSGFAYRFSGEGAFVTGQIPAAGSVVLREGAVILLTLGESVGTDGCVPSVVGMTAAEANQLLLNAGFNISITGARDYWKTGKTVVEQIPAAGATLPYGTVVTLRFAYDEIAE